MFFIKKHRKCTTVIPEKLPVYISKNIKSLCYIGVGVLSIIFAMSGCASAGASDAKESLQSTVNSDKNNKAAITEHVPEPAPPDETIESAKPETIKLKAWSTAELYEGGKLFLDVPEEFVSTFPDKVAEMTIPDARKGERATGILENNNWFKGLVFLNSIPDKNIYLYGYNDSEHFGEGLILDIGIKQHIYAFPYWYMTSRSLAPEISTNQDGSEIFVSCHTGSGTGVAVSELYVFQVNESGAEPFYADINKLVGLMGDKLSMSYDTGSKMVTVSSEGKQIAVDTLVDGDSIPEGFYCGNILSYLLNEDTVKVICTPTIYKKDKPGMDNYLENVSLEADLIFERDDDGRITEFNIGEISAAAPVTESIENQLQIIADHSSMWLQDTDAEFYGFAVTDLDHNGRLEVIFASCGGTGIYSYNQIWEINEEYNAIKLCEVETTEGESQADIIKETVSAFCNPASNTRYYIFDDLIKNGAAEYYENKRAISLEDGKIVETLLAYKSTRYTNSVPAATYTDVDGTEIDEQEYDSIADRIFGEYEKHRVSIGWVTNTQESINDMGAERLYDTLKELYDSFLED